MKIVLVSPKTSILPKWKEALLKNNPDLEVELYPEDTHPEKTEFILTWNPPEKIFERYPNLKVVSSMGAGINHIIKHPRLPDDVIVTKVNDPKLKYDMSIFALTLVLGHLRNLPSYYHQKNNKNWQSLGYSRPEDKTVGIIGLGSIGREIGKKLSENGIPVKGWSESKKELEGIESFYGEEQLDEFLEYCEIAICTLPLTETTSGILNDKLFQKLPDGAYLVNLGRGSHLVENDLWQALESGKLSGAALDVFDEEPLPDDHPFWEHPHITITPHVAGVTDPESVAKTVVDNARRFENGKDLKDVISVDKGY